MRENRIDAFVFMLSYVLKKRMKQCVIKYRIKSYETFTEFQYILFSPLTLKAIYLHKYEAL